MGRLALVRAHEVSSMLTSLTQFETIKRMQAFYRNLKAKGDEGVTPDERENLKNALVDYGHLQSPAPEQSPASSHSHHSPAEVHIEKSEAPSAPSPLATAMATASANLDPNQQYSPSTQQGQFMDPNAYSADVMWDVTNPFEYDFDFNSADFDAIMADATQGFWVDFPGEVGFT